MTKEEAFITALGIVNTCRKNETNCCECPFNTNGCILTDGNNIPSDWRVNKLIDNLEPLDYSEWK